MSDDLVHGVAWFVTRARGVGLAIRLLVLAGPLTAVLFARLAADRTLPAIELVIIAMTLVCVVVPDSHVGLLVVVLVGIDWLTTVHDPTSAWSLGVAVSLTIFHASMAAAIVAPLPARWTRAMCRRWLRRSFAVVVASAVVWAMSVAVSGLDVARSGLFIAATLIALALGGLWARDGTFDAEASG